MNDAGGREHAVLIGERVRTLRRAGGLSLGALAASAQVGKGSLSEIENGTRNPTLSTLYALAHALGVPMSTLLAEQSGVRVDSPGISSVLVDVRRSGPTTVEVYRLDLTPGTVHRSAAHGPGVVEHLLVTSGRARVGRAGEELEVGVGGRATWVSDVEHTYAAAGGDPVESVLVILWPTPPEPAAERP